LTTTLFYKSPVVLEAVRRIDPQAWLADVLGQIAEHPRSRLDDVRPRN
jgi:hypothetical protein